VFIDHETAIVGVRLGSKPLHERDYRAVERMGALKPPVAAAMVRLAEVQAGQSVLDPCCGSGTILLEAAAMGADASGGDFDAQAVQDTRANMRTVDAHLRVEHWDARRLPLEDANVDAVVSNLPWGRQIALDEALSALYAEVCLEIERVLRPGGRAVLLTTSPELLRFSALELAETREISLFGQNPVISVFQK
jgi:23S rRNA G2445 N2-methylase RlmL